MCAECDGEVVRHDSRTSETCQAYFYLWLLVHEQVRLTRT